MAVHSHLPPSLQNQLTSLASHVRFVRLTRGLGLLAFTTLVLVATVGLIDAYTFLQAELLQYVLFGLIGMAAALGIFGCLLPAFRPMNWRGLAAVIEEHYPELHERLLSSVELDADKNPHGSKQLIGQVLAETNDQAKSLVFTRAIPKTSAYALGILASLSLLACGVLFVCSPSQSLDFTHRLLMSWNAPPPIEFDVSPGDGHAAYRRTVEFEVKIHRRNGHIAWPSECQLVIQDKDGQTTRVTMQRQEGQTYTYGLESLDDAINYRIEAGGYRSRQYLIEPVEPVELVSERVIITITPPNYLSKQKPKQHSAGTRVKAIEYSQIECRLPFTRPAQTATLRIAQIDEEGETSQLWTYNTNLDDDRTSAIMTLPALPTGQYKISVRMEAEHKVTTTQPVFYLQVHSDTPPVWEVQPPRFGRTIAFTEPGELPKVPSTFVQTVRPKGNIPLQGVVRDKEGIDAVAVEYRVNQGVKRTRKIVNGKGNTRVVLENLFSLPNDLKEGNYLFYRIVATDNRDVPKGTCVNMVGKPHPKRHLGAQRTFGPIEGWFVVQVRKDNSSLAKKEIEKQRDLVKEKLEAIKQAIRSERKQIEEFDAQTRRLESLSEEHRKTLKGLIRQTQQVSKDVDDLKQTIEDIPEFLGLAGLLESLYSNELNAAATFLETALTKQTIQLEREQNVGLGDAELLKALKKLGDIEKLNQRIAETREKMRKLTELARQQEELSNKTAKIENQKDTEDPGWKAELEKLQKEQAQIAQQLAKMAKEDPSLNNAFQMEKANQLAEKANALAKKQQQLIQKKDTALQERIKLVLNDFAKKQQAIVDQAKETNKSNASLFDEKRIQPPATKPGEEAANALRHNKAQRALAQQDQQTKELLRGAARLRGQKLPTNDPRQIIQKLAQLQKQLVKRLKQESGKVMLRSRKEMLEWHREIFGIQRKIAETTKSLLLPSEGKLAKTMLARTRQELADATKYTRSLNPLKTLPAMEQAQVALEQLARVVPPTPKTIVPEPAKEKLQDAVAAKEAENLRQLAVRQDNLRRELQKFLQNPTVKMATNKKVEEEQKALAKETNKLAKDLANLAQNTTKEKPANTTARMAAKAADEAQQAMKNSQQQANSKKLNQARQSDQQANRKLKQAASAAKQTAMRLSQAKGKPGSGKNAKGQSQANKSFQEGQKQATNAQTQLSQSQPQQAKESMQMAANAMRNAANQMSQQLQQQSSMKAMSPKKQTKRGMAGVPPALQPPAAFKEEFKKYEGKRWGELPGELKSRMMMEMRARYGEAYATIIQQYFEEIANTRGNRE
ncbi:MAG: hypothetical protein ACFCD0_13775 [Gemmataceae bacterium]